MEKNNIPIHKDIRIPKRNLPRLPAEFERTTLGYPREGALAQYRGPNGIHVHEYNEHWLFHRDYGDPRTFEGLLAHLLFDAPEIPLSILAAGASGIAVGSLVYELRKNESKDARTEAIIAGGIASIVGGVLTFFLAKEK
jgi:hypothetical protein